MTRTLVIFGTVVVAAGALLFSRSQAGVPAAEAASVPQPTVQHITDNPAAPYSPVVRVGNMLYLSGKLGVSRSEENGIQSETRRAMERVKSDLEANGSGMDRVVKCLVMLADQDEWGAMNEVYSTFFPEGKRPARSAFEVGRLAADARVEIECMAAI